ncbi:hypothetical protein GGE16_005423 [Rhizobium leguminosarum]|uniref:Uncharacterized protein n=1 Tax=Rhizobium leguminosarum TaxID=384 RepID=A0AAE2SYS1_RHILE|nr:hypothetical protein [Rhizobium leguminosarum]MBB4435554.1 hypothetical protein [Rhizobium esperanzae]MBB4296053.1 hypothetical protein [Rhizobium leguminosarum]MBB4311402.1 hypothetical protein [Rhizobium leguminosarum]MBB4532492.1 hypothetical protein [Rhizobium leguminosarum]
MTRFTTGSTNNRTGKAIAQESAHADGHIARAGAVRPCALRMLIAELSSAARG